MFFIFSNNHYLFNEHGLFKLIFHHLRSYILTSRCFKYFFFSISDLNIPANLWFVNIALNSISLLGLFEAKIILFMMIRMIINNCNWSIYLVLINFYKEKLSPHPHVLFAFGFSKINPFPLRPPLGISLENQLIEKNYDPRKH